MSKSRKGNNKRRNRKTRRHKLKGGETKAALYVWKNPYDKTLHKRIFVDDGMDYTDWITDAGYNLRWIAGEGGNTIPRKIEKDAAGEEVIHNINPYVKYLTADYSDGIGEELGGDDTARVDGPYVPPPPPSAPPASSAGILNANISEALNQINKTDLLKMANKLGLKTTGRLNKPELIPLIIDKLIQQ